MRNREKEYEKRYAKKRQWLLDGKCRECGAEKIKRNPCAYCLKHYLIGVANGRLGSGKYWKDIMLLLEKQNFRCALTGDTISFDDNIELDHIIPSSKKGLSELNNVRWVTKEANRLKQNLSDTELLLICQKVINHLSPLAKG